MERLRFALVVHPEPRKRIVVVSDPTEIDFANLDGLAAQIALVGLSGPGMPVEHPVPAHDFFALLCNTETRSLSRHSFHSAKSRADSFAISLALALIVSKSM